MAIFRPREQLSWCEFHLTRARRSLFKDTEWGKLDIRLHEQMRANLIIKHWKKIRACALPSQHETGGGK